MTTVIVFGIALCAFAFGAWQFVAQRRAASNRIFHDIGGRALVSPGNRWRAILIGSVDEEAPLMHAFQVSAARRARQLDAIVLATDQRPLLDRYARTHPDSTLRICALQDNYYPVRSVLNVVDAGTRLFLLDPLSRVVFVGGKPHPSDVDLLLQRYMPVARVPIDPLRVGNPLSVNNLIDLRTLQRSPAPANPMLAVVFTGRCTVCALETHLSATRSMEANIDRYAAARGETPLILFTSYFNPNKLHERLGNLGFTTATYETAEDLPSVDELTARQALDVVIVETDASAKVVRLTSLDRFELQFAREANK